MTRLLLGGLFLLAMGSLFVTACSPLPRADPVQQDLLTYLNQAVPRFRAEERRVQILWDSVTGENYVDEALFAAVLEREILPPYRTFVEQIAAEQPATPELAALHNRYVEACREQLLAFELLLQAIRQDDRTLQEEARNRLAAARQAMRAWHADLTALAQTHHVILVSPEQ